MTPNDLKWLLMSLYVSKKSTKVFWNHFSIIWSHLSHEATKSATLYTCNTHFFVGSHKRNRPLWMPLWPPLSRRRWSIVVMHVRTPPPLRSLSFLRCYQPKQLLAIQFTFSAISKCLSFFICQTSKYNTLNSGWEIVEFKTFETEKQHACF